MFSSTKYFAHLGEMFPEPEDGPFPPNNGYITEDSLAYYVAEDGTTYYVQE